MSSPLQQDRAALQAGVAHDGQQQRGLADAVAAEHGEAAVARQLERDVVEHHGVAVARAHAFSSSSAAMALSKIDLAHALVARDLVRRAFDQDAAADHHDDAAGEAEHHVHVVLDEQHA